MAKRQTIPPAGEGTDARINVRLSREARIGLKLLSSVTGQSYEQIITEAIQAGVAAYDLDAAIKAAMTKGTALDAS